MRLRSPLFIFILAAMAILAISMSAHASIVVNNVPISLAPATATPAPPPLPGVVSSLTDGLHFLDNATPSSFRDVVQGQWLAGAATSIYKQWYLSLDAAYAVPIGQSGFYAPAIRLYIGQILMDQVPAIRALAQNNLVLSSALNYITVSGWATRDFVGDVNRAGYNLGILLKFGQ
jgi:hypothetical protein